MALKAEKCVLEEEALSYTEDAHINMLVLEAETTFEPTKMTRSFIYTPTFNFIHHREKTKDKEKKDSRKETNVHVWDKNSYPRELWKGKAHDYPFEFEAATNKLADYPMAETERIEWRPFKIDTIKEEPNSDRPFEKSELQFFKDFEEVKRPKIYSIGLHASNFAFPEPDRPLNLMNFPCPVRTKKVKPPTLVPFNS
jgi:hypothetical protein